MPSATIFRISYARVFYLALVSSFFTLLFVHWAKLAQSVEWGSVTPTPWAQRKTARVRLLQQRLGPRPKENKGKTTFFHINSLFLY